VGFKSNTQEPFTCHQAIHHTKEPFTCHQALQTPFASQLQPHSFIPPQTYRRASPEPPTSIVGKSTAL